MIALGLFALVGSGGGRHGDEGGVDPGIHALEIGLDLLVALVDLGGVDIIELEGLAQGEQVLGAVIADQGLGDGLPGGLDAEIAQGGQPLRIALSGEKGADDAQAGDAGDVADHVVELEIHLDQGFLHVLDVGGGGLDEPGALAPVGAQDADLIGGAEGGGQQAVGVELLQPLAILDVGLAAGKVFDVVGVDQADVQSVGFQDLGDRDPVDAGGFHGDRGDAAGDQPAGEGVEVLGEAEEASDRVGITIGGNGHEELLGADVDAGGVGVDQAWSGRAIFARLSLGFGFRLGHGRPPLQKGARTGPGRWMYEIS